MKLLFDRNLSPKLVRLLSSRYPDSSMFETFSYTPQMMNRYGPMQLCMAWSSSPRMLISIKEVLSWVRRRR